MTVTVMVKRILFVFIFAIFVSNIFAQDPSLHIYLCFGQSNMSGQGPVTNEDLTVDDRFLVLRAANHSGQQVGQFYPGLSPLGHSASQLGPADFFGRKMVQLVPSNVSVAVANIAIGGQSIDLFDKSTKEQYIANARAINDWWIPYLDEYGGDAYNRIIEMGEIAKQQGVIKGILFHQGEADYNRSDWSTKVKKVYDDIIQDLGLNSNEVPILIGELLTTAEGGDLGWRNDAVAETTNLIPNGHLISAAGCPMLPGDTYRLHFSRDGYKILGERYATTMFDLLAPMGGPTVIITSPQDGSSFETGESITITATATDEDGTVTKVEFFDGTTKLGETTSTPYTFTWTSASAGAHTINVVATDNDGNEGSSSINITVNVPQSPYNGTPFAIPGKIELEEFDLGGNGSAYYDETPGSDVDLAPNFRTDEDVDIENCSDTDGGYNIGYALSGEWLEYTTNVTETGTYNVILRVACEGDARNVSLSMNGTAIATNLSIPNTGGWQIWQDLKINDIQLTAGIQILRLTIGSEDYINLNNITFESTIIDLCPNNPSKTEPGECGCDNPEGSCSQEEPIQLSTGWNLIGCPLSGKTNISEALQSIWQYIESVKNMDSYYIANQEQYLNTLTQLDWGKGYLIKVSQPCELIW